MHPVNYLFDEINRELWGMPGVDGPTRKHEAKPAWPKRITWNIGRRMSRSQPGPA